MKISVVTILPELIEGGLAAGVVAKAAEVRRYALPTGQGSGAETGSSSGSGAESSSSVSVSVSGSESSSVSGSGSESSSVSVSGSESWSGSAPAPVSVSGSESASSVPSPPPVTIPPSRPLTVTTVNPRDFTTDRHRTVDDTPYGGGPGMVMKPEPLLAAIAAVTAEHPGVPVHRVLLTPVGVPLTQATVRRLAALPHLVLVCGRYEGIDERLIETAIDEEISIGDYVLSGGELGALVVLDAVARLLPGVLGEPASAAEESFSEDLLEYPQYTRPWKLGDRQVPDVLASGNHGAIASWRRARSLERTARRRPELYDRHRFTKAERKLVAAMPWLDVASRAYVALVHHPVLDKNSAVVTSAVTNFDIHDIARSSRTYGMAGYYVVTPVAAQQDKVRHIARMWTEQVELDHRASALELVRPVAALPDAIAAIEQQTGRAPRVVATSANPRSFPAIPHLTSPQLISLARADERPLLLVFGTGWGLADAINPLIEQVLSPIDGRPEWNHLSVRSAVAITLDRLFGLREQAVVPSEPADPPR